MGSLLPFFPSGYAACAASLPCIDRMSPLLQVAITLHTFTFQPKNLVKPCVMF